MKRAFIAGGAFVVVLVLLSLAVRRWALRQVDRPEAVASSAREAGSDPAPDDTRRASIETTQGFLYGRIGTVSGAIYEGRLRWGRSEEAFWGDYFNGAKRENTWSALVAPERLPRESHSVTVFGFEITKREKSIDLGRLFMARFGDIARIEAHGKDVHVKLKSGTVFVLDRMEAGDFDDDVRVWDRARGVVDLDSLGIRTIELVPTPSLSGDAVAVRLHGTVRTRQADFTGFLQWDRQDCVGSDTLDGRGAEGDLSVRFDTIRSIAHHAGGGSQVTLLDGRQVVLTGTTEVGEGNKGIYVDDPRFGRVLVSWDAFESAELSPAGSGPAYDDFPAGRPLMGSVTTRDGRRLAGRIVYDLDESETTETLDAPAAGVDYTVPFGLIASILLPTGEEKNAERVRVSLQSGQQLELERSGDLGEQNAGILIFEGGGRSPEYVPWTDVARIDLDRPSGAYPPPGER